MYQCTYVIVETGELLTHTYTPPLPRDHVHPHNHNDHCDECDELRGIHNGDTAVARRHGWSTRIVARGLDKLAHGASYASVSQWAVEATGQQRTRARPGADGTKTDAELDAEIAQRARERRRKQRTKTPSATASPDDDPFLVQPDPAGGAGESGADSSGEDADERAPHVSEATRRARNLWHIAADWVEAFAPVIYDPVAEELDAAAKRERQRLDAEIARRAKRKGGPSQPLERPQVVFVDDVPVYGQDPKTRTRSRRDAGYFVLVVAELHWVQRRPVAPAPKAKRKGHAQAAPDAAVANVDDGEPQWTTVTKLRLLRVMAKSNTPAWRLVFAELGYEPDFIVADAGTGIKAAIDAHFDKRRTVFIPSLYHLSEKVKLAFKDVPGAFESSASGKRFIKPLHDHFAKLSRFSGVLDSAAAWKGWWDELERIIAANKLPRDTVKAKRKTYEPAMATALGALGRNPLVPLTTGGLETLIARKVKPLLAMRRTSFGNLERTNHLFDLVVAEQHGAFNNLSDVAAKLRHDGHANDGWTVPLRSVSDPRPPKGSYSSLRDTTLLDTLAIERGVG